MVQQLELDEIHNGSSKWRCAMKVASDMENQARDNYELASIVTLQALFRGRRCQEAYAKSKEAGKLRLFVHKARNGKIGGGGTFIEEGRRA